MSTLLELLSYIQKKSLNYWFNMMSSYISFLYNINLKFAFCPILIYDPFVMTYYFIAGWARKGPVGLRGWLELTRKTPLLERANTTWTSTSFGTVKMSSPWTTGT